MTQRQTGGGDGFRFETALVADDWRDLTQGEVIVQDTSFTAEQTEVAEIYSGLKERIWPDVWYELIQGAFEYNDWTKGVPEVIITYADGESVSLQAFVRSWPQTRRAVQRVTIQNHINGGTGLRPSNTYFTQHQEKAGATEFSKHGRGLKVALTAIASQQLAAAVTFESYAPQIGSWFGQARMAEDRDPQAPDYYQVAYKTTQNEQVQHTKFTVEAPSHLMLEALVQLQDWFLPLHPDYQFSPLSDPMVALQHRTINHATLVRETSVSAAESTYTPAEKQYVENTLPENGRAEIISLRLLPDLPRGKLNWLYVDGWRVTDSSKNFANIYAFSGMSKNVDQSRNPSRSNDSLHVEGNFESLIADTLYFVHDSEVFYRIFKYGWNDHSCAEWANDFLNSELLASFPETLEAVTRAVYRFLVEKGIQVPVYITETESLADEVTEEYGIPALYVNSGNWSRILLKTGLVRSVAFFLKEEAEKQKIAAEARLKAIGILEQAVSTGEVVKLQRQPFTAEQQHQWLSELAYILAGYDGVMQYDEKNLTVTLNLNNHAVDGLPNSISQLNELGKLINRFYALFGGVVFTTVESYEEKNAAYMNFSFSPNADTRGNHSLNINQGKLVPGEKRGVVVAFKLNQLNRDIVVQDRENLRGFFEYLAKNLQKISYPDGRINSDAYGASELAQYHPQAYLMNKLRTQRESITAEMEKQLAAMNAVLEKAGLPQMTMADFAEKPNESTAAEKPPKTVAKHKGMFRGQLPLDEKGRKFASPFDNKKIKNGPRTFDKTIDLGHPDEAWGLSSLGEEEALLQTSLEKTWYERWRQELRDSLEKALKALVNPDISFNPGPGQFKINRYLVHSVDSSYSALSVQDYQPLPKALQRRRLFGKTSITFNKPDPSTELRGLPCPYGYRPIGYFTRSGAEVYFSGMPERGYFGFRSPKGIEAGLTVYFEPIPDFADTAKPDEYEAGVKVIEDNLLPHWQDLIAGLRASSLTDKQKVDVLLRAWKRNQSYKKEQRTFDMYQGMSGYMLATAAANFAEGNCGYIDLGFIGLVSTLFPTRSIKSFLFTGSGLDVSNNRHGLSQVYIDGRWVAIEAQGRYVEQGYEIEPVPEESRAEIEALFNEVPESLLSGSFAGLGLAEGRVATVDRSRVVPTMQLAMLFASLQAVGVNVQTLIGRGQVLFEPGDNMTSRDLMRTIKRLSVSVGLGLVGVQLLDVAATKLVEIAVNYRIALEGLPAAAIFDKIYQDLNFLGDPRTMMVLVILLTVAAWQGGYEFGRFEKEPDLSNPVPTNPAVVPAVVKEPSYDRS